MTEVTRTEFEQLSRQLAKTERTVARHETQYAVINTKLTAILWLLSTLGAAVIAAVMRMFGGGGA